MITYKDSGVDPVKNDKLVEDIKQITGIFTGFAADHEIPAGKKYITQCADGVGTKIQLAETFPQIYKTIGYDLVAMCVNDLICTGAVPAFFQDYIGMNVLDRQIINTIIESINEACVSCGVVLSGGEMAEMPNSYTKAVPELVGFATGFNDDDHKLSKDLVKSGDNIIGLKSSGPHSNGYSLIRAVLKRFGTKDLMEQYLPALVEPTTIYTGVNDLHQSSHGMIHSLAHITGGGLENNLRRAVPEDMKVFINYRAWARPDWTTLIQNLGEVPRVDMWTTFNMGIGMCVITSEELTNYVMSQLEQYDPIVIGKVY